MQDNEEDEDFDSDERRKLTKDQRKVTLSRKKSKVQILN